MTNKEQSNHKAERVILTTNPSITALDQRQWNMMVPEDDPSLQYEFLRALEDSGSCISETGWAPCHIAASIDGQLIGGAPCYLKNHSYGEFVFDWAWANAYERAGMSYYPKLLIAVPFTPVSGARIISHPDHDSAAIRSHIAGALPTIAEKLKVSSVHCIFCNTNDLDALTANNFVSREGRQFHWHNPGYQNFDDFLSALSSKKRKNIIRERRRVKDQGIQLTWVDGPDITTQHKNLLYACYQNTIREHGSYAYLTSSFFENLIQALPNSVQMLVASKDNKDLACGFFLRGKNTLYGRYWGALEHVTDLHFEVCYYTPIEYCIEHQLLKFEAGAQGEHKLSRGLTPQKTLSAHWLVNPGFHEAVKQFTLNEQDHLAEYTQMLESHSPFKQTE
ncbi:GNAT family N-acetyltransferase [Arenicellales bacterium IMCC57338]